MHRIAGATGTEGMQNLMDAFEAVERTMKVLGNRPAIGGLSEFGLLRLIRELQNQDKKNFAALDEVAAAINEEGLGTEEVSLDRLRQYADSAGSLVRISEGKYRLSPSGIMILDNDFTPEPRHIPSATMHMQPGLYYK